MVLRTMQQAVYVIAMTSQVNLVCVLQLELLQIEETAVLHRSHILLKLAVVLNTIPVAVKVPHSTRILTRLYVRLVSTLAYMIVVPLDSTQ
jgi:hypothetical protein